MRLITFGCSYTFGSGLEDIFFQKDPSPSKLAWPQLLANKLNVECVNRARDGSSNKEICYTLQNFEFQEKDLVVVLWTHSARHCIIFEDKIKRMGPWKKDEISKFYFKWFHTTYDSNNDFWTRSNFAKLFLDSLNIKNYHFFVPDEYRENVPNWNKLSFLPIHFGDLRKQYPLSLDNMHPGEEFHRKISNELYKRITSE